MKQLSNNEEHFKECHRRWVARTNRSINDPERPDEWCAQECNLCAYYVRLTGLFADDYGACSNAASKCDGKVMFEHDGCERFVPADSERLKE